MSTHQNNHGEKVNMEISKLNFVRDGATRLPPGFRFQPTDQEIVFQYLIRKVFSCPLPASIVPEIVNICKFNPWDLPGDWEQDRYFFSKKDAKYGNGHRSSRASDDGYWKATGFDKQITRCCNNNNPNSRKREIITGMKKTLVFYKGKPTHGESTTRSYWIMHEYRLVHSPYSPKTISNDKKSWIQMGNWVLCHIFLNKRSRVVDGKPLSNGFSPPKQLLHHDFTRRDDGMNITNHEPSSSMSSSSSSSSSCGSSVVTQEVSSNRMLLDHEDVKTNIVDTS